LSLSLFIISLAAVVSFISLYFYEIPTHHCPFDILQSGYHFIGFPLYITLFGGVFFGIITGLMEPFKKIQSLHDIIIKVQKKWALLSIVLIMLFTLIASWPIVFSSFTLEGYY
jgi:Na+/phosphate symporter